MRDWIGQLLDEGLVPYVATSENYLDYLDFSLFEGHEIVRILENPDHSNFHEAYLVSNSLAFGNPELKMQNWVYIDCVLMQTAVVGFALPVEKAPATLIDFYEKDPWVDVATLDYIPVSGQIAALGIDGKQLTGFSLFSLRRQIEHLNVHKLAHKTKYAALSVYRAEHLPKYVGISQYDNKALLTHTLFGKKMYIDQTTMPLHPLRNMSFTYSMKIELDESRILGDIPQSVPDYDFLLRADDTAKKLEMQERIRGGERFYILDPVHIRQDNGLFLPICCEKD
ncbi:MAG: hypothetical protein WC043_00530 [Pseudobdellovibrionaceae bacterium]